MTNCHFECHTLTINKNKETMTTLQNNKTTEDQKYLDARMLMMQYERIGKTISLEKALKLTDW